MTAKEFYEANATTTVNVPRVGHPEDKSGWDGVRRASQAQYIAPDVEVMPLWDVFDFAEKFKQAGAASQGECWVSKLEAHQPCYAQDSSTEVLGCGCGWDAPKGSKWANWIQHFKEEIQ